MSQVYNQALSVVKREVPKRNVPMNLGLSLDDLEMIDRHIELSKSPWNRQLFTVHALRFTDLSIGQGLITYPDLYEFFKYGLRQPCDLLQMYVRVTDFNRPKIQARADAEGIPFQLAGQLMWHESDDKWKSAAAGERGVK
jgi:hypothetical protein